MEKKENKFGVTPDKSSAHHEQSHAKKPATTAAHKAPTTKGETCSTGKGSTEKCGKKTHIQDESTGTC